MSSPQVPVQYFMHDAANTNVVTGSATQVTSGATLIQSVRFASIYNSTNQALRIFNNGTEDTRFIIPSNCAGIWVPLNLAKDSVIQLRSRTVTASAGWVFVNLFS